MPVSETNEPPSDFRPPNAPAPDMPAIDPSPKITPPEPKAEVTGPAASPTPPRPRKDGRLRRILILVAAALLSLPLAATILYKFIPPPITLLMVERLMQGQGLAKSWRGLNDIAPPCPRR